jgi:hypothetical protein
MARETRQWRGQMKDVMAALVPPAFAVGIALGLSLFLGSGARMDMYQWSILRDVPQKGLAVVVIALIAGYVLIAIGTWSYIPELQKMTGGASQEAVNILTRATKLTTLAVYILFIFGFYGLYLIVTKIELISLLHYNDGFLLILFAMFWRIDHLTVSACECAQRDIPKKRMGKSKEIKMKEDEEFGRNQILFIDIPVLVVIAINLLGTILIQNSQRIMQVDLSNTIDTTKLAAIGNDNLLKLKEVMGTTLVAGLACGMVGAHIVFSQVIFLILRGRQMLKTTSPIDNATV